METNTVFLDLEKYNELRDFKKNIEAGEIVVITRKYNNDQKSIAFMGKDEVIEGLIKRADKAEEESYSVTKKLLEANIKLNTIKNNPNPRYEFTAKSALLFFAGVFCTVIVYALFHV